MRLLILSLVILLTNSFSIVAQPVDQEAEMQAFVNEFQSNITQILQDFEFNFENLKSTKRNDNSGSVNYDSKVQLLGAQDAYLFQPMFSSRLTYVASFYDGISKEEATMVFDNIVLLINLCAPKKYNLVFDKHIDDAQDSVQPAHAHWLPFDLNGVLPETYDNLVIELRMNYTRFLSEAPYSVVVNIKKIGN